MSGFLVTSELKPWGGREAALCAYHSSSNWSRFASPFSVSSYGKLIDNVEVRVQHDTRKWLVPLAAWPTTLLLLVEHHQPPVP
eukprot:8964298-Ditylum_brightwellii.AAC.1